jgi:hypothetical protein
MHAVPRVTKTADVPAPQGNGPSRPLRVVLADWHRWAEALGVLLSPAAAALVLRIRLMAPIDLPDPAMHTTYIVDPRQVVARYAAVYASTSRLRESARVGFLVPARLAYLAFGAVHGFVALRYVFALIAIVPIYLLLRRMYGPPAGVVGILVVLSSPVIITAWGTDYPDSAVVSYAAGAIACLAMPCSLRWRRAWLAAAGGLLVTAVWSHGVAAPLAAVTIVGYVGVRLVRDRARLTGDLVLLAAVAVAVTGLLMVGSEILLGHANFIATTWHSVRYLSQASQVAQWHSASWRWAPYVAYLLIPPATLGGLVVAVARSGRTIPMPVLLIGVMTTLQLAVYAWLQFFGTVQALEQHYFSSTLWAGTCVVFAITIAELARPLADRPLARWLPAAVVLAVPLGYEADPHVPAFRWLPAGAIIATAMIATVLAARGAGRLARPVTEDPDGRPWRPLAAATAIGASIAALVAAALVLTVAPIPSHPTLPGTVGGDPPPAYATALGGNASVLIDNYRIAAQLPLIAGPAYPGEQLVIWWPISQPGFPYREDAGMFHGMFNTLSNGPPVLSKSGRKVLSTRRPAEVLLFARSAASFRAAVRALAFYRPAVLRKAALRSGPLVLHVWLVRLDRYYHPPRA